jgi:hypothetical protein
MTPTDLKQKAQELIGLTEKATPGPWSFDEDEQEIHSDSVAEKECDAAAIRYRHFLGN